MDGRALTRCGFDLERAANHLHPFAHPEQSQTLVLCGVQRPLQIEGFTVVADFHVDGVADFSNIHFHMTGVRMLGDVGKRFLGDAIERRALVAVQSFHPSERREMHTDACPFHEVVQVRMQGHDQPQIVQGCRAQLDGELMHDVHRLLHQPLCPGDFLPEHPRGDRSISGEGFQLDIDAHQGLGDVIMQFPANPLSLLFSRLKNAVGQVPQLLLHAV